jgi:ABC-type sugar transport system ATPase subunit
LVDEITARGKAVILITSEMTELIGMCDRIAAVKDGKITKIFNREEFSQETILKACV